MATQALPVEESLFSLELVVDKLSLPKVVCRFPAVAFRLLDFPTLLIYHVEPDLGEVIRKKLSADPHYKVPHQLHELQDKHGDFSVRKGKSCLFKVPLKLLHTHLSNAPLYVMVIDTYPEVPKLIGSCSIPLDDSMQLICNDVESLGLSVPSVHGERGVYPVFNLMGSEIGKIELGFRLLSLGVGLIPHIPDNAVVKFKEKTISLDEPKDAMKAKETADVVLRDIQAADKPVQVDIFTPGPTMEQTMQTEEEQLQTVATQTAKGRKYQRKQKHRDGSLEMSMSEDIFVTNTLCPPPLYYNSEAEPKIPIKPGLTFLDGISQTAQASSTQAYFLNGATPSGDQLHGYSGAYLDSDEDNYSEYSDSTIRHEDKFSDSDTEEVVDFNTATISTKRKPLRKTLLKSTPEESRSQLVARATSFQAPNVMQNMTQFPLINALLTEILNLQGMRGGVSQQPILTSQVPEKPPTTAVKTQAWEEASGSPKSARRQEAMTAFLRRMSTPRGFEHEHGEGESGYHKGTRSCVTPQKVVPKNQSWLRKEPEKKPAPEYGVKKTKLFYGMTNTQRLRLAKGNPELLKTLEKKEELRLAERRKSQKLTKPIVSQRSKQGAQPTKSQVDSTAENKLGITLDITGRETMESPKQHKKPVPTPRLSLTGGKQDQKVREHFTAEKQRLIRQMARLSRNPTEEEEESSERSYHTAPQSDRSQKSIEIYLPSVDAPADDSSHNEEDATSVEGSEFGETALGQTKVLSGPGFPRETAESRLSMVSSYSAQYSDDFEDEQYGKSYDEPALRRVVEQYSESSGESAQEPSLRKVVDQYSDEGEEPSLRKVVDRYSDDDDSNKTDVRSNGSYQSVRSNSNSNRSSGQLTSPEAVAKDDMKIQNLPMPNPTSSLKSPTPHLRLGSSVATREAMAASTPTADDDDNEVDTESEPDSSTARIPRSQMPSQSFDTGTSLDSTGEAAAWRRRRQPRPSPRRSLERIRTESVSSYNPSDPENVSPVSPGEPEDLFSEISSLGDSKSDKKRYAKDIKIPAGAKGLGYTWT